MIVKLELGLGWLCIFLIKLARVEVNMALQAVHFIDDVKFIISVKDVGRHWIPLEVLSMIVMDTYDSGPILVVEHFIYSLSSFSPQLFFMLLL